MDIAEQLQRDEGLRLWAYKDSVGIPTIGYGRNLVGTGISKDEADYLLANDIARVKAEVAEKLPWSATLDEARLGVLWNMAFNIGVAGLMSFHQTLQLVQDGKYDEAADAMLKSKWATQVGPRASRLSEQMRTGSWV